MRGDTNDRAGPVARFQQGKVPLFLISLKAGGTGLNLTAADTVIHYDPWWNPAVEDQATDRAHRIGQDKPVFVYKLVAQGTVEERMLELQQRKKALAAGIYEAAAAMPPPASKRPTSSASSSRWGDLLPCHRQAAEVGNGLDRAVGPDPVGHDDGEQQQTDRDRERQRPAAGAVEDPGEGDR